MSSDDLEDDEAGLKYEVRIEHDESCDNPADQDGSWTIYSFCSSHVNFKHPCDFRKKDDSDWLAGLRKKLKSGLAFILSYYEHGLGMWYIQGTKYVPDAQWDNVNTAGLVVWEHPASHIGAKTYEDRKKDCESLLEEYTNWCNGTCYFYAIEDLAGNETDACGGFFSEEHLCDAIAECAPDDMTEENTRITGDCAWVADHHNIFPKPKVKDAGKPTEVR